MPQSWGPGVLRTRGEGEWRKVGGDGYKQVLAVNVRDLCSKHRSGNPVV